MAEVVGAGDLGLVWEHLDHLVSDILAGDYGHAVTHVWPILDQIRMAMAGVPVISGAVVTVNPAIPDLEVDENKKAKVIEALNAVMLFRDGMKVSQGLTNATDWKALLKLVLALLNNLL